MLRRLLPLLSSSVLLSSLAVAACSGSDASDEDRPAAGAGAAGRSDAGGANDGGSASWAGAGAAGAPDSTGGMNGAAGEGGQAGAASGSDAGAANDGGSAGAAGTSGTCSALVEQQALATGTHVAACTAVAYASNPPSSGQHYPTWADFGAYDFALPRGYWVHNLEHGAVVVTYNCPSGCEDELEQATTWLAQLSPDAACPMGTPRVLLVPDPLLDVRWAASSWGFTLRAECFDADVFSDFYSKHAGQPLAPEAALCGTGFDFRADGAETCGAK